MPELQITDMPTKAAPNSRITKQSERFELLAVNANFDGSGAGSAFLPCVEVISDSGAVVSRTFAASVAAGSSAEVTFAPFLRDPNASGTGGIQFDTTPQTGTWLLITTTGKNAATSQYGMKFVNTNGLLALSDITTGAGHFTGTLDTEPGFFQLNATTVTTGFESNIEASSGTYLRIRETNTLGGEFIGMSVGTLALEAFDNAGGDSLLELNTLRGARFTFTGPGMGLSVKDGTRFPFLVFNDGTSGNNRIEASIDDTVGWFKITNHTRDMVVVDGAGNVTARLPTGGKLEVQDNAGNPIFRVDEDGDLHGLTGKALVFDL